MPAAHTHAPRFTTADFDANTANGVALVDFYADWCPPCRVLGPTIDDIAHEFAGRAAVAKVDVDAHPDLASRFGVRSIPTVIVFKDGKPIDRFVGIEPAAAIRDRLNRALA